MANPPRIQRRRTKGWRMPAGAVYVGRGTQWGNPLPGRVKHLTDQQIVSGYRDLVVLRKTTLITPDYIITIRAIDVTTPVPTIDEVRTALAGKNLVCWCHPDTVCHADVLLALANSKPELKRVLHLYGLRRDRVEAETIASQLVTSADRIVHHWRPYTAAVLREHTVLPPIPGSRLFKWLHLAVIGALVFVLGVVVWNQAGMS